MWSKAGTGGEHHRYYKHTKFRQNPISDPKFLVNLTRNDPYIYDIPFSYIFCINWSIMQQILFFVMNVSCACSIAWSVT